MDQDEDEDEKRSESDKNESSSNPQLPVEPKLSEPPLSSKQSGASFAATPTSSTTATTNDVCDELPEPLSTRSLGTGSNRMNHNNAADATSTATQPGDMSVDHSPAPQTAATGGGGAVAQSRMTTTTPQDPAQIKQEWNTRQEPLFSAANLGNRGTTTAASTATTLRTSNSSNPNLEQKVSVLKTANSSNSNLEPTLSVL